MPGQDGTGPLGQGPLTGRGFGPCGRGLGFRRGFCRGFGWRRQYFGEPVELTKEQQKRILEEELKEIDIEKEAIEKKLKEFK
jgi:hypothetical protein